jgi:hypothetical protein
MFCDVKNIPQMINRREKIKNQKNMSYLFPNLIITNIYCNIHLINFCLWVFFAINHALQNTDLYEEEEKIQYLQIMQMYY